MKSFTFLTSLNREITYEYHSSEQGTPLIFLNGLSDSYMEWKKISSLTKLKTPFLFVDLIGQGASLQAEFSLGEKYDYKISLEQQGQCLIELCDFLSIPKFGLVGFSYGGGLALWLAHLYPEKIEKLILFLPFLLRLDLAFPISRFLHSQYDLMKKITPAFFQSPYRMFEKSYENFVRDYMHFRFTDRIPHPLYREAAVQISEGVMNFNVFSILQNLPDGQLHLVSSDLDTLIPKSLMREFWSRLPHEKKQTWTRITDGEHLLFDQNPVFCAQLLENLLAYPHSDKPIELKVSTLDRRAEKNIFSAS